MGMNPVPPLAILNAMIVDPAAGTALRGGVLVRDRHIAAVGSFAVPDDATVIDARGAVCAPGSSISAGSRSICRRSPPAASPAPL
jgi:predicted amidohydrolase